MMNVFSADSKLVLVEDASRLKRNAQLPDTSAQSLTIGWIVTKIIDNGFIVFCSLNEKCRRGHKHRNQKPYKSDSY